MKLNFVVLLGLLMLVAGVIADSPTCYTPAFNTVNQAFDFADGLNQTVHVNQTYDVSGNALTAEAQARLGMTGLTIDYAMHEDNSSLGLASTGRSLAYLGHDVATGIYTAAFQYNGGVWVIPNLQKQVTGGETHYSNSKEPVWFTGNAADMNLTAVKLLHGLSYNVGAFEWGAGLELIKLGNGTYYQAPWWVGLAQLCTGVVTSIGQGPYNFTCMSGAGNAFPVEMNAGNSSTLANMWTPNNATWRTGGVAGAFRIADTFDFDYFGCGAFTGTKTYVAWEGSQTCNNLAPITANTCTFTGPGGSEDCTLNAGSSTNVNTSTNVPSYKDVYGSPMQIISPPPSYGGDWCDGSSANVGESITILKPTPQSSETKYLFWDAEGEWSIAQLLNPAEFGTGTAISSDLWLFNVLRLNSPTGSVNSTQIYSLDFNTQLQAVGMPCETDDYWNVTTVLGKNSSYFQKQSVWCWGGTLTTGVKGYDITLNDLLEATDEQRVYGCSHALVDDFALPIWKDEGSNSINRFAYIKLDMTNGSIPSYSSVYDDTFFQLNYTKMRYDPQTCTLANNPFGFYTYECSPITDYYTTDALSGTFTLNSTNPTFGLTLEYQQQRNLTLNITITQNGMPLDNMLCISQYGSDSTDYGECSIPLGFQPDANITVTFPNLPEYPGTAISFPIGDYYNSQGYGDGESCADFDGVYAYSFDVRDVFKSIQVKTISNTGASVSGAAVYLDDSLVCSTRDGSCTFQFPLDFNTHTMVAEKSNYVNGTITTTLYNTPLVTITLNAKDGAVEVGGSIQSSTDLFNLLKDKTVLGFILVLAGAGAGAATAGVGGAAVIGIISVVLVTLLGWVPWYVLLFLVAAISLAGAGTLAKQFGGGA